MDNLTNDAKFLMSSLYERYLFRRKQGASKSDATFFDDIESIHENIMSEWSYDDTEFTCFELKKHNFLVGQEYDNGIFEIYLTTEAIALLEITFMDKVDSVLEYAAKVKSAIPFI